jgi:hypothetical protein
MKRYQKLLDEFMAEMSEKNRILAGKWPALKAFAGWLDDREAGEKRRQREKSDSYTVPVQSVAVRHRGDGNE